MVKQISRRMAVVLAMVMLMTSFAFTMPVNAASKADMKKANVKWDLKNNKKLKFKTKWSVIGVKTHTVKMTNYKVKNAKKKGYKQCTFTLTFNRKINPTKKQIKAMAEMEGPSLFGGGFYFTVVDYKTGKCLETKNDKNVTVTYSGWKYSSYEKKKSNGWWIRYPKKSTTKVTITYPKNYKDLAIGVGGHTNAPKVIKVKRGVSFSNPNADKFFNGKQIFSKATLLYSKKDKSFAHFMRVK